MIIYKSSYNMGSSGIDLNVYSEKLIYWLLFEINNILSPNEANLFFEVKQISESYHSMFFLTTTRKSIGFTEYNYICYSRWTLLYCVIKKFFKFIVWFIICLSKRLIWNPSHFMFIGRFAYCFFSRRSDLPHIRL